MNENKYLEESRDLFIKAFKENNFLKASFLGEELIKQHKKSSKINSYEYCVDLYNLAIFYQKTGSLIKACKFHKENILFFSNIKEFKENSYSIDYAKIFVDTLNSNGVCYTKKQDFKSATENFEKAFDISKEHLKLTRYYFESLHNLGSCYYNLKNYEKAIGCFLKILEENLKKDLNYTDALNYLGYCYEENKDFNKALSYFKKALKIIKRLEGIYSKDYIANMYYIACVFEKSKNYEKAILYFHNSLKLIENKYGEKSSVVCEVLNKISNIYVKLNQKEKAIEIILKSLNIIRSNYGEKHIFYTNSLRKLGNIYFDIKDYKNALIYYKKESKLKCKIAGKESGLYIESLLNLVKIYIKLKDKEELEKVLGEILNLSKVNIKNDIYEKALLLVAKMLPLEDVKNLSKIQQILNKKTSNLSIEKMIDKANKLTENLIKDYYLEEDLEEDLKNINKKDWELLENIKDFLEKNFKEFDTQKNKIQEIKIKSKLNTPKVKRTEHNAELDNNNAELKESSIFPKNQQYIQENLLDFLSPKNKEDENN